MRIIKALKHLFYLNIEQYKYTRNLWFLCKSIVLQSIGALNLFTKDHNNIDGKLLRGLTNHICLLHDFEHTYVILKMLGLWCKNYEPEIREVILNNSKKMLMREKNILSIFELIFEDGQ